MKHLKTYRMFEAQTETHWETYDIFHDLLDRFGYEVPEHVYKYANMHDLMAHGKYGSLNISDAYHFGAKCLKIRITASGTNRSMILKQGCFKNFDGVADAEYSEMLQECHRRMVDFLDPVDVVVGSLGEYTRDLDLLYFYDKPDFSRYSGVEIYGSNIAVRLEKLGVDLMSNSRHENCFTAFERNTVRGIYYLMAHYDGWKYTGKISEKDAARRDGKGLCDWIDSEWKKVCLRLKIKDFQAVGDNPKITVAEFMSILKKNQDSYASFSREQNRR